MLFQSHSPGEIKKELTTLQISKISMFLNIADLAGLRQPHLLYLIESRLLGRQPGQILTSHLNMSSLVNRLMRDVLEEKPATLINICMRTRLLMRLAQSIKEEDTPMALTVPLLLSAKTACLTNPALSQMSI